MKNPGVVNQSIAVLLIWLFYLLFYVLVTKKVQLSARSYYLALGGLTYPLYLIHRIAGESIIDQAKGFLPEGAAVIITMAIMIFVSCLMHIGIEKKVAAPLKVGLHTMHHAFISLKAKLYGAR